MKKLIMISMIGLFAVGTINAQDNKATSTVKKGVNKTEKGVKHGAYDATHNKVTKKTDINSGNTKYKGKDDVSIDNNKAGATAKTGVNKTEKGVKHGAYDATHNKATKETDINDGNVKYQNKDDIK